MGRDLHGDVAVCGDPRVVELLRRDEGIVVCAHHERRHPHAIDDPEAARPVVVVVGVPEPVVRRGEVVVEVAHRPYRTEPAQIEAARPRPRLPSHPALQVAHEVPLIEEVRPAFERLDAHPQVHRGRDRDDRAKLGRRVRSVVARKPHGDVAPERVAGDRDRRQPVERDQLLDDRPRVGGEPRVVQPGRQRFGAAAVALVQQNRVHARRASLVGKAAHVVRLARAFEAVECDQRRVPARFPLPVAVGEHAGVGGDVEIAGHERRQAREVARAAPGEQGHPVAVPETRVRNVARGGSAAGGGPRHRRGFGAGSRVSAVGP